MLHIVFTTEDLAKIRMAAEPDYLWEVANSVQTLRRRDGVRMFREWRRWARSRIPKTLTRLAPLLPPQGYSPDFLTPASPDPAVPDVALNALLSTPRTRLRTDLARLAESQRRLPRWTGRLAEGDLDTLRQLEESIRLYHARVLAPIWPRVQSHVYADRIIRMRSFLEEGVDGLLSGLGPQIQWSRPVLEVDYPFDQVLHLEGRGITLQPSYFCWPTPVKLADPQLPPVLVYPVERDDILSPSPPALTSTQQADPVGALIGRTRAGVLRAAATGSSTGELARLLDISPSAVSQHAAILRENGLLQTFRKGGRTMHTLTAHGRAFLQDTERVVHL
ncbi:ArsR/SmtB family transcription factor [Actinomadura rudentiformis]|uniref:Winged helix-turn-helix transcriptional regulator n=1 Tax=Actinomadura rudentiformis TaxID=359158 RepID=A0A6H9Z599_9ACTN|nr:winged helix-turn-helix domain-containing protein [Actinomadura rudentiformis]KAB2352448.1 winged helix-turn-helix transcriptional regulator [Actinomadura rudentiformis]